VKSGTYKLLFEGLGIRVDVIAFDTVQMN